MNPTQTSARYAYDALGRRTTREYASVDGYGAQSDTSLYRTVYEGMTLTMIAQLDLSYQSSGGTALSKDSSSVSAGDKLPEFADENLLVPVQE